MLKKKKNRKKTEKKVIEAPEFHASRFYFILCW